MKKRTYISLHWDEWYLCAARYRKRYGDLLVPSKYATQEGYKLGRWIERQRSLYHKHSHIMTEERKEKLNAIDMVWRIEDRHKWDFWISCCSRYYEEHQHLQVPVAYITEDGALLGNWIVQQRRRYRANLLSEAQIGELDTYEMRWEAADRKGWTDWYQIARYHYQKYGSLDVNVNYIDEQGNRLGMWLSVQREKYRHVRKPYLQEQEIMLLNEMKMKW